MGACRYVAEVTKSFAWVALAAGLRARLHALDSSDDTAEVARFAERFHVGQPLHCSVLQVRALNHWACQADVMW